jgi:lipid-A-disaccharide synthase-like uncharacterized protein
MNQYVVLGIGFFAQGLFSARLLVQWISSEKAGRSLSPLLFWQLSILGSLLLMVYGIFRRDLVIIVGQVLTYCIYIRNLHYQNSWSRIPRPFRLFTLLFPFVAMFWLLMGQHYTLASIVRNEEIPRLLLLWGGAGQLVFNFRFVYQLIRMERAKASILPLGFWVISIVGSFMVISYAVFRRDPVLFIGQLFGVIVYSRNIVLFMRTRRK